MHICCSNPGRVDAYTRMYTHVHASRWHTRRVVRTCAYVRVLPDPYMWARPNEIWPDVYFQRSAGRCRASSKTHPVHTRFAPICVRACLHTRVRPDSLFESHVLYRWHCTYLLLIFVVARVSNLHVVSVNVYITNRKNGQRKNLLQFSHIT